MLSWEKVYNLDSDDCVLCQRCVSSEDNDAILYHFMAIVCGDSRISGANSKEVHSLGSRKAGIKAGTLPLA